MRLHPAEFYAHDVEQTVHCENCNVSYPDILVTWFGSFGVADCPECDCRIEIESAQ